MGRKRKALLKGWLGGRWDGESRTPLGVGLSLLMPSSTDWLRNWISRKPRIRVMDPGWENGAILWDSTAEWNVRHQQRKKAGVGTNAYVCFASDYREIALTFSYHFLCNDWKLPGMIPPRLLCYQKLCLWKTTFSHLQTARGIASSHRPCASLICTDLSGFFLSPISKTLYSLLSAGIAFHFFSLCWFQMMKPFKLLVLKIWAKNYCEEMLSFSNIVLRRGSCL